MKNFNDALTKAQNKTKTRESTRGNYRSLWTRFAAWCKTEGYESLPPSAGTIGEYLRHVEAKGHVAGTINTAYAVIAWQVRCFAKVPDECRPESLKGFTMKNSPMVEASEIRDSIIIDMEQPDPRRARGITMQELTQIFREDSKPRVYRDRTEPRERARTRVRTDRALFLTMFNGLLRSQEAVDIRWADIQEYPDGSADLYIRKTKTSAKRRTRNRYLLPETVEALNALKPKEGYDPEDFVFTARQRDGKIRPLCRRTVSKRIKAACRHAGIRCWDEFSSHSFRVGGAMHLYNNGATLAEIMDAGDWHSSETVLGYIRAGDREQSAVKRLMSHRIAA